MPRCPQCHKSLPQLLRRCPSCQADLELLVDYVHHLQGGLERAENLIRAGELDQAVWAYLEVLEVDPDNAAARKQVGRVATAVRQFDRTSSSRAWWRAIRTEELGAPKLLVWVRTGALFVLVFVLGWALGYGLADPQKETDPSAPSDPPSLQRSTPTLGGPGG